MKWWGTENKFSDFGTRATLFAWFNDLANRSNLNGNNRNFNYNNRGFGMTSDRGFNLLCKVIVIYILKFVEWIIFF